jgi:hypothetical protein
VTVTEQLDPNLDWGTFQLGDFGFGDVVVSVPAGRTSYSTRVDATATLGVLVDVDAEFNLQTGAVTWTFTALDPTTLDLPMDPLAGLLPPNQDAPEGQGFVTYTVNPRPDLATGARINAQATVVFDTNDPINTPLMFNTIDAGPPASSVQPLPVVTPTAQFQVRWGGQDDAGGSGIAGFDVYVSDNGGPFTRWLTGTTETSALFPGVAGHTYGFYSIATDNVGHTEAAKTTAEAVTTVVEIGLPVVTPTILVDNTSFGFTTRGTWALVSGGYGGSYRQIAGGGDGSLYAQWQYSGTFTAGTQYGIYVTWVASPSNATNARYKLFDGATPLGTVFLNQTLVPNSVIANGFQWQSLLVYTPATTGFHVIRVQVDNSGNGNVIADALFDPPMGESGADTLRGGPGDDLLSAGTTAFDADALAAVAREWSSGRSFERRVADLRGDSTSPDFEPRLNGDVFLKASGPGEAVFGNQAVDHLFGQGGRSWYFATLDGPDSDLIWAPALNDVIDRLR